MVKTINNIFKIARTEANLTQEVACFKLGIKEVGTLSRYENDVIIPSDEIVNKMVNHYHAKWLGYAYLQQYTKVGRDVLPPLTLEDLGLSVLKFQKEFTDIKKIQPDIIEIACDGIVGQDEAIRWDGTMKEIKDLISASISLLLKKERPSQECNLERATV